VFWRVEVPQTLLPVSKSGFAFNVNAYGLLCDFGLAIWMLAMITTDRPRSIALRFVIPVLLATTIALSGTLPQVWSGGPLAALAMQLTLLGCYLLWTKADLLLFGVGTKVPRQISTC